MIKIKNRQQIVSNGQTTQLKKSRALALACLEHAVNAVEPKQLLKAKLQLEEDILQIEDQKFDLAHFKHVYVVGGGKASGKMAEAIEELLGKNLTAGAINVPYGSKQKTRRIKITEANHPVPDQNGVKGTLDILALAEKAGKDDLVVCLISGGGSSLMPLPREGVSLEDKQALTGALLKSGAQITEVNIVRKHLSAFKGGWLAKKAHPATVLNLILSDVMGDPLDSIASGPTVADPSTFQNAKAILEKYSLWESTPASVRRVLSNGAEGKLKETPKPADPAFKCVHNIVIGNNKTASTAALDYLASKGLNTLLLPDMLKGEAKQVGAALAKFTCGNTAFPKPLGIVVGGETTVTVTGKGVGGRNQELALSAALNLGKGEECVVASFSTDGVDGPTDAAGAVADGYTLMRAEKAGLKPEEFLEENYSHGFFQKIGDLIVTGATSTNVNDLCVIVAL